MTSRMLWIVILSIAKTMVHKFVDHKVVNLSFMSEDEYDYYTKV